ncbi:LytR/AlgR family response regulator transcription factor [Persicitalea sp.]|uniref:LytR/AlgR family response regulator transcription factor n=1 Tax=Persicitalea sp. TaxID=3100273 RepID=UPI0035933131
MNATSVNQNYDYVHIGSYEYELPEDILYCEGDRNYSHVHFVDGRKTFVSTTLGILEARLARRGFRRINRSYLVNADQVLHHDRDEITLMNGITLPIARRRRVAVRQWLTAMGSSTNKLCKYPLLSVFGLLFFTQCSFGQIRISDVPLIASGARHAIPLSQHGYRKSHYSVLVKVRLAGDTIYHSIPGQLPGGHSLSFLHKSGRKKQGDTLFVIHRWGEKAIALEEIWVQVFHKNDHLMYDRLIFGQPDRGFARSVIASYYNERTLRGTIAKGIKREFSAPMSMPSSQKMTEAINEIALWQDKP